MLKRLFTFIFTGLLLLIAPSRALALDTCPRGRWSDLCNLNKSTIENFVINGITILFVLATVLALFFLIFGGIKWITSGGDKANLESARGMIVAAVVGLIITFLSYFAVNLVLNFFGITTTQGFGIPTLIANP